MDSDFENSSHGNEGGQQEKAADDGVENGDIATDNHTDNKKRGTRKRIRNETNWSEIKKKLCI